MKMIIARHTALAFATLTLTLATGCELDEQAIDDDLVDPIAGVAVAVPGKVQAEAFLTGGEGVGYHDTTARNLGGALRPDEAVDLQVTTDVGGGHNIGWTEPGEWTGYSIAVATPGVYRVIARVASARTGTKSAHLVIDGAARPVASTSDAAGWQSFGPLRFADVSLTAGTHALRVVHDSGGLNLNYLDVQLIQASGGGVRFGTSAVTQRAGESFATAYARLVQNPGSKAVFIYYPAGKNPTWALGSTVPPDHEIVVSSKVHDLAVIQAFVDQVPRDRPGLVYVNYWQEPEDDFDTEAERATYRQRAAAIAPIVNAHPRMRFGVCLMNWSLYPASGRNWRDWVVPGMKHIGWSLYATSKGDADKAGDGRTAVTQIRDVMAADGRPWGAIAWGFSLNAANYTVHDRDIRAKWMRDTAAALKEYGATHAMWFNTVWGDTDYTIETDSILLAAWREVSGF